MNQNTNIEQCKAEDVLDYIINGLIRDPIKNNIGVPTLSIPDSTSSQELAPNTLYIFPNRESNLTLTLGDPIVGKVSEYHCIIVSSGTPTITWPSGIQWIEGDDPEISDGVICEVSILNNIAVCVSIQNES